MSLSGGVRDCCSSMPLALTVLQMSSVWVKASTISSDDKQTAALARSSLLDVDGESNSLITNVFG